MSGKGHPGEENVLYENTRTDSKSEYGTPAERLPRSPFKGVAYPLGAAAEGSISLELGLIRTRSSSSPGLSSALLASPRFS